MRTGLAAPRVDCQGCNKLTKCCAFQPFVPNFLLGGFFQSQGAAELPKIKNLVFQPLGAIATLEYRARHDKVSDKENAEDLLCGFYKEGQCTIWNFRPGECSTYFCDEDMRSQPRQEISERAFRTEIAVAQMALLELGLSHVEIGRQVEACNTSQDFIEKFSDNELLFMYKKSWNWSQGLSAKQVLEWLK